MFDELTDIGWNSHPGSVDIEEIYRKINASIGQFILMIHRRSERHRFSGPNDVRESDYHYVFDYYLSVIANPIVPEFGNLNYGKLSAIIVDGYVKYANSKYEPKEGTFSGIGQIGNLDYEYQSNDLHIFIGDKEVEKALLSGPFNDYHRQLFFSMMKLLGRVVDYPEIVAYQHVKKQELFAALSRISIIDESVAEGRHNKNKIRSLIESLEYYGVPRKEAINVLIDKFNRFIASI